MLFQTPPHNAGPPTDLEGSATKYQHLPKDDDSSDAGDEGKKNIQPLTTRGTEKETSTKENLKYVDVDFLGASPGAGKPQTKRNGDPLIQQSARQNYARIDYDKQSSGSPPPPPPLPPPPPPPSSQCTPQITVQQVNEPVPRGTLVCCVCIHVCMYMFLIVVKITERGCQWNIDVYMYVHDKVYLYKGAYHRMKETVTLSPIFGFVHVLL